MHATLLRLPDLKRRGLRGGYAKVNEALESMSSAVELRRVPAGFVYTKSKRVARVGYNETRATQIKEVPDCASLHPGCRETG